MIRSRSAWISISTCVATVAVVLAAGFASATPSADEVPIPRVCWFSDYANAKLSNGCVYDKRHGRWMKEVDGRMVDARTQRLPVANLCHYFHGTECP